MKIGNDGKEPSISINNSVVIVSLGCGVDYNLFNLLKMQTHIVHYPLKLQLKGI